MQDITIEKGRININMKVIEIGDDVCVIISGGDRPHIGCVTLSIPRPSLADQSVISATTSVLNRIGHKDEEAAKYVSHTLSSNYNKHVVVTCGIHVNAITKEEINDVMESLDKLMDQVEL